MDHVYQAAYKAYLEAIGRENGELTFHEEDAIRAAVDAAMQADMGQLDE